MDGVSAGRDAHGWNAAAFVDKPDLAERDSCGKLLGAGTSCRSACFAGRGLPLI